MDAFIFIQRRRRSWDKVEIISVIRLALHGEPKDVERQMERWARDAEVPLTFEE